MHTRGSCPSINLDQRSTDIPLEWYRFLPDGTAGRTVNGRVRDRGRRLQVVLHHDLRGAIKLRLFIEQCLLEELAKQSAHVLVLVGGPPALQEADVTPAGGDDDRHVRGLGRGLDRDGIQRLERIVGGAETQQRHFYFVELIVQRGLGVVRIYVFVAKVLRGEQRVELLDGFALKM